MQQPPHPLHEAGGARKPVRSGRERPMTRVTLRMPVDLLREIKVAAAARGRPYRRHMRALLLLGLAGAPATPPAKSR